MVQDFDPMAEHRPAKIADREDEYLGRRRMLAISPTRHDPFAPGLCVFLCVYVAVLCVFPCAYVFLY